MDLGRPHTTSIYIYSYNQSPYNVSESQSYLTSKLIQKWTICVRCIIVVLIAYMNELMNEWVN